MSDKWGRFGPGRLWGIDHYCFFVVHTIGPTKVLDLTKKRGGSLVKINTTTCFVVMATESLVCEHSLKIVAWSPT